MILTERSKAAAQLYAKCYDVVVPLRYLGNSFGIIWISWLGWKITVLHNSRISKKKLHFNWLNHAICYVQHQTEPPMLQMDSKRFRICQTSESILGLLLWNWEKWWIFWTNWRPSSLTEKSPDSFSWSFLKLEKLKKTVSQTRWSFCRKFETRKWNISIIEENLNWNQLHSWRKFSSFTMLTLKTVHTECPITTRAKEYCDNVRVNEILKNVWQWIYQKRNLSIPATFAINVWKC